MLLPSGESTGWQTMSDDKQEKDGSDPAAEDSRAKRSFIEHLLSQPEGPNTPRAKVVPQDIAF